MEAWRLKLWSLTRGQFCPVSCGGYSVQKWDPERPEGDSAQQTIQGWSQSEFSVRPAPSWPLDRFLPRNPLYYLIQAFLLPLDQSSSFLMVPPLVFSLTASTIQPVS